MFADLVQCASTGVLQVAEMKLKHFLLQLTELDSRLLKKVLLHLLDFFCGGKIVKYLTNLTAAAAGVSLPLRGESWFCDLSFLHSDTTSRMALKWKSMRLSMAGSVTCPPS